MCFIPLTPQWFPNYSYGVILHGLYELINMHNSASFASYSAGYRVWEFNQDVANKQSQCIELSHLRSFLNDASVKVSKVLLSPDPQRASRATMQAAAWFMNLRLLFHS